MTWPTRWRGHWIWWERADVEGAFVRGESPSRPPDGMGYLRRTFTLDDVPERAPSRITCDGRYALFVNGTEVGRGPVRAQPWRLTFDSYDLGPHLRAGENVVAIQARHYGGPTVWWQPARPVGALGYGSLLFEAAVGSLDLVSDESWRARVAPLVRVVHVEGPPPNETLDGRAVPWGWTEPGFDDAAWAPATIVDPNVIDPRPPTEPFATLAARPIGALEDTFIEPVAEHEGVVDMGRIVNAHPIVCVDADPGAVIEVRAGEEMLDGEPVTDVRDWRWRYTTAGVPNECVVAFEPVGFRFLRIEVLEGNATVQVAARERIYPREAGASFRSSDPALDAIYLAGVHTVDLCSTDAFIDGPGREQRAWLSDSYGHSLVSLLTNPDTRLVRWMLRLHAGGVRPDGMLPMVAAGDFGLRADAIPDQALIWILAVDLVHRVTGDDVEDLLPVARGVLDYFERLRGEDGLIQHLPGWVFIDWAQVQRGRSIAAIDGLYALATRTLAELARARGDTVQADALTRRADQTARAFEAYVDPDRGVYVDAIDEDGRPTRRVSQHANALAILAGCAPRARWDSMLDAVLDPTRLVCTRTPGDPGDIGERVNSPALDPVGFDEERQVVLAQPFFSHFIHRAVVEAGRHELLNDLIRRWTPMVARGGGTLPEYWDAPPGRASLCHAWSAVPVHDLITEVLGVKISARGVVIEPHLGDLDFAEGAVASEHGWVRARIQADGSGWIETPIEASFIGPDGRALRVQPGRTELRS